jgi:tetratricopeptide (TPR) repeat protein
VAHRLVSYSRPSSRKFRKFAVAMVAVLVVAVVGHALTQRGAESTPEYRVALDAGLVNGPGARGRDVTLFSSESFTPLGFVPPESPFFPAPATTSSGGFVPIRLLVPPDPVRRPESVADEVARDGFVQRTPIGAETCVRCHPDIVAQWATSAHRFASFNNPFYEASVNDTRDNATMSNEWIERHLATLPEASLDAGGVKTKWCAGCHDPALLFTGKINGPIDRADRDAQAGLTCLACHLMDLTHDRTGNANYNLADEQDDPYVFSEAAPGSWRAFLHDAALKAKPTVHKRRLRKPYFGEPEYCGTCHKVRLVQPVNNYRWLRGQDEFDNWHDSGVSRNASRTFYLPAGRRICQDCHMPLEPATQGDLAAEGGFVRSHRFVAANTALPFVRGDWPTIRRIEAFLQDEKLSVDIFALRSARSASTFTALDRSRPVLLPGETITVDVVVRNRGVGHTFPGGTNDSNEGWLEFRVEDDAGTLLAISGALDADGHLDPLAHGYMAVLLDRDGNVIERRNGTDIHVTAAANVIGPGSADLAHFEFRVPPEMGGRSLTLRARLLWRKFNRAYTEFAFRANPDGFRRFDSVPELPVTEIASDEIRLSVVGPDALSAPESRVDVPEEWMRYNDYGIALLREGNTRAAVLAFERVAAMQPERIDGNLNLARVAIQDGNLQAAYEYLERVESLKAGDPQAAWVWGLTLQEDGRYEEAELAFRRVLEEFPDDRAAWRGLGRTLYLDQRYEEALLAFERVLEIDPEDRVSHYHRMLSFRALGRTDQAARAEAAYERYRIDEAAQAIAGNFRLANPGVNLMAQPLHTHVLEPGEGQP